MSNEPEITDSGIYIDTKAGEIVHGAPEEGVQLVAPGGEVTASAKEAIDRYEATRPVPTDATDPEPVKSSRKAKD